MVFVIYRLPYFAMKAMDARKKVRNALVLNPEPSVPVQHGR
jgi:hypothetical protein